MKGSTLSQHYFRKPKKPTSVAASWTTVIAAILVALFFTATPAIAGPNINLADGFDFPVGKPDASGYYKARGLRLRSPTHFGEDWNGRGGGNSDLGDPVYAIADGIVTFAHNIRQGWGRVAILRHAYRNPKTGKVSYVDSLYGHLHSMPLRVGQKVKRGQKIGSIGNNFGMYPAHLHFEIRYNLTIGMQRKGVAPNYANWADPTKFINQHRRLKKEWRSVSVPTNTYAPYKGFKGL